MRPRRSAARSGLAGGTTEGPGRPRWPWAGALFKLQSTRLRFDWGALSLALLEIDEPERLESLESPELMYSLSFLSPPSLVTVAPLLWWKMSFAWLDSFRFTREFTFSTRRPRLSTFSITFVTFSEFLPEAFLLLKMPGLKPNLLLRKVVEEFCSLTKVESPLMFWFASFKQLVDSTTLLVTEQLFSALVELSTTFFGLLRGGATGPAEIVSTILVENEKMNINVSFDRNTKEKDGHGLDDKDKLGVLRGFSGLCNSFLGIGLDSALQYLRNNFGLFCNYLPIIWSRMFSFCGLQHSWQMWTSLNPDVLQRS